MIRYRKSRLSENRNICRTYRSRRLNESIERLRSGEPAPEGWSKYEVVVVDSIKEGEDWDDWEIAKETRTNEFYAISPNTSDEEIIETMVRDGWLKERDRYLRIDRWSWMITFPYNGAGYYHFYLDKID